MQLYQRNLKGNIKNWEIMSKFVMFGEIGKTFPVTS